MVDSFLHNFPYKLCVMNIPLERNIQSCCGRFDQLFRNSQPGNLRTPGTPKLFQNYFNHLIRKIKLDVTVNYKNGFGVFFKGFLAIR